MQHAPNNFVIYEDCRAVVTAFLLNNPTMCSVLQIKWLDWHGPAVPGDCTHTVRHLAHKVITGKRFLGHHGFRGIKGCVVTFATECRDAHRHLPGEADLVARDISPIWTYAKLTVKITPRAQWILPATMTPVRRDKAILDQKLNWALDPYRQAFVELAKLYSMYTHEYPEYGGTDEEILDVTFGDCTRRELVTFAPLMTCQDLGLLQAWKAVCLTQDAAQHLSLLRTKKERINFLGVQCANQALYSKRANN